MTGDHRTPNRRPDPNRMRPPRRPAAAGIPPLRFPRPPVPQANPPVEPPGTAYPDAFQATPLAAPPAVEPSAEPVDAAPALDQPAKPRRRRKLKRLSLHLPNSWQFWGLTLMVAFCGIGLVSAITLLKLPASPNCPAIFWPTASASLRLYCAQTLAEKRTVNDLLRAIDLVKDLPSDHPLRSEIDREIEEWAKEILSLGEEAFQQGRLKEAISTARRIPQNTSAYKLVDQQIQSWNTLWSKAEDIYKRAEEMMRQDDLRQAFRIATQLLGVDNTYWQTTKYKELNDLITATRQDGNTLGKAQGLAEQGGLSNLLAAVKLVEEIKPSSYLYQKAEDLIVEFARAMLDLATVALEQRNYDEATSITQQVPERAGLKEEIKDFNLLAQARAQAWGGTIDNLTAAIAQAQKLANDRPLYGEAQQLISTWQLEIQDVKHLTLAQQLAQGGAIRDLSAAIAEARQVPFGNPREQEAQELVDRWTAQIQTIEDRPYLDQAEQLAGVGNIASLEAAINYLRRIQPGRALSDEADQRIQDWTAQIQTIQDQPLLDQARQFAAQGDLVSAVQVADQIRAGRSLYGDAQADIRTWTGQLQEIQDQPYLVQARQLAARGDLTGAISTAEQIGQGRTLYDDAQTAIQDWRQQSEGQTRLQQAYDAASVGTPAMLRSAIQIASQVPADNPSRAEADQLIDRWSGQILQIAQATADYNLVEAIAIAQSVPPDTSAHATAQQQIRNWRRSLGNR